MRRTVLLFVVLGALTLSASLPAFPQEGEPQGAAQYEPAAGELQYDPTVGEAQYDPGVGETQYAPEEEVAQSGCSWQWGYRWNSAGAWEWWCWDPQMGWWYATNEDGSKQFARINKPGSFIIQT
jgi:hypothetical protein